MMFSEIAILKLVGVSSGALVSFAFFVPRTLEGIFRRLCVCLISGMVFTTPVREYLGWNEEAEYWIAAAFIASFCSWWAAGAFVQAIEKFVAKQADPKDTKPKD